jgi:hypothetical protein
MPHVGLYEPQPWQKVGITWARARLFG